MSAPASEPLAVDTKIFHTVGVAEPVRDDAVWQSCCFRCNPHAAQFIIQVVFSLAAFGLAAGMLASHDTQNQSLWVGILTLLLGVWVPAPNAHHPQPPDRPAAQ